MKYLKLSLAFASLCGGSQLAAQETVSMEPVSMEPAEMQAPPPIQIVRTTRTGARNPAQIASRLFYDADLPAEAFIEGHEGRVQFEVEVDASGNPSACNVVTSSGFEDLDALTCNLVMERARFEPAYNADNEPVAGTFQSARIWRARRQQLEPMEFSVLFTVNERGVAENCEVLKASGALPQGNDPETLCDASPLRPRGVPFRDENGVPVAKEIRFSMSVEVQDIE